jgi:acetolactate synthase I/III small subunit
MRYWCPLVCTRCGSRVVVAVYLGGATRAGIGRVAWPALTQEVMVSAEQSPLEQVTKQLNKLVNVLRIVGLDHESSIQLELLPVKAREDRSTRSHVPETAQLSGRKVVDVTP